MADFSWSDMPWLDLLNSDWHDYLGSGRSEDRLENPAWLGTFLSRWKLDLQGVPRNAVIDSLRSLRQVIGRNSGQFMQKKREDPRHWRELNSFLERAPFLWLVRLSRNKPSLEQEPVCGKMEAVLGQIALSFVKSAISSDAAGRIKVCGNKDCRWIFYDRSKNRSRRWCENTCGNLIKVRRFRMLRKKSGKERP